jgi:serine/threonine protein kinase/multidrug efflux pump subunit AcrA (membrane-fusion protein)
MVTATCPNRETLLQYSSGKLPDEQSDELARHLESCPDCQATIVTLEDVDDTLIGRLRTPLGGEPFLAEPEFQAAVDQAIAMPGAKPMDERAGSDAMSTPPVPQILGEYRILEELGRGGMGRVYKALHTKLDRVVAIKILRGGRTEDGQALARFGREMKAIGQLDHPNLVRAHDAREIDGTPVLIMEFVDGLDLAEIVRRLGPLPVADACELVRQTALGLQRAHEHGLVHRDIKPSNIMLIVGQAASLPVVGQERQSRQLPGQTDGQAGSSPYDPMVKLLDLGLARFYAESPSGEEMTGTGQAMGTADYMAPEQASDSRTVDIRADIYSLGCALYKLLSGRAPFSGPEYRGNLDKMNAHVSQPAPPIRRFVPEVHDELAAILDRMLAKAPGDRFATPAEVAEALQPFCAGANLANLAARASAEDPLSSRERTRMSEEQVGIPKSAPIRRRSTMKTILLALAFLGAIAAAFAAGVVITIKKNGQTYQLDVPPKSQITVDENGNATVSMPGQKGDAARAPVSVIDPEALDTRDAREIVSVRFELSNTAERNQALVEVRRLLGPGGSFSFSPLLAITIESRHGIPAGSQIVGSLTVIDEAGRVRQIRDMLKRIQTADLQFGPVIERVVIARAEKKGSEAIDLAGGKLVDLPKESDRWSAEQQNQWSTEHNVDLIVDFAGSATASGGKMGSGMPGMSGGMGGMMGAMNAGELVPQGLKLAAVPNERWDNAKREDLQSALASVMSGLYLSADGQRMVPVAEVRERRGVTSLVLVFPPATFAFQNRKGDLGLLQVVRYTEEPRGMRIRYKLAQSAAPSVPAGVPPGSQGEAARPTALRTSPITRGDLEASVEGSGTIEADEVIDVAAQVSGTIDSFAEDPRGKTDPRYKGKTVDYGTPVEEGTVLARIDDAIEKARLDEKQAALARAQAELEVVKSKRPPSLPAELAAAEAALAESRAALKQAEINLGRTIIRSPVKGIVADRRVRAGQIVAPDPKAPALFLIAKDTGKVQARVTFSDGVVGRIPPGTDVRITPDASPNDVLQGKVTQIRNWSEMWAGTTYTVTYRMVIDLQKQTIQPAPRQSAHFHSHGRVSDVLRAPTAALRWIPRSEQMDPDARRNWHRLPGLGGNRLWMWILEKDGEHVRPIAVQVGLGDSAMTEVSGANVKDGLPVVVGEMPRETKPSDGRGASHEVPAPSFAKPQSVPPGSQSAATGEAPAGVDIFGTSPKMKRIRAALAEPTVIDLDNKSFANVIDYLKQRHKIEIQFDHKALQEAGFDINKQVTIHVRAPTLRSVLRLLLRAENLTYVIQDDVLLITTTDEAGNKPTTMVYPVGDLVLPQGASSAEDADFDSLINMITSTVQPTTWKKAGGPGTISASKSSRTLVLSQTEEVHEDVAKLLETLRSVKAGKGEVLPARRPGGEARPERGDGRDESYERSATPFAKPQSVPPNAPNPNAGNAEQARAIAEIEKLRGTSEKSARLAGWFVTDAALAHLKGLTQLESLTLANSQATNAGLVHVKGLTNLQSLDLTFTKVTDAGVEHIKGLTKLQSLNLHGVGVTDAGLDRLKALTNLQELSLYNTAITDAGLERLQGFTKLKSLDLGANGITGAGLKHLKGLTQLQSLNLIWTGTTDAGLEHLKPLTQLRSLNLYATSVTDAGLEHLKGLLNLQSLVLWRTKVTDAGLKHLKGLTKLESLVLRETRVTDAGIRDLRQALPACRIEVGRTAGNSP